MEKKTNSFYNLFLKNKNYLVLFFSNILITLLGFIITIILSNNLSLEDYSAWIFLISIMAYIKHSHLGSLNYLSVRSSQEIAKKNFKLVDTYSFNCLISCLVTLAIFYIIVLIINEYYFVIKLRYNSIFFFSCNLIILQSLLAVILRYEKKFISFSILFSFPLIIQTFILTIFLFLDSFSFKNVFLNYTISFFIIILIFHKNIFAILNFNFFNFQIIIDLLRKGSFLILIPLLSTVFLSIDKLYFNFHENTLALANYGIAAQFFFSFILLSGAINNVDLPSYLEQFTNNKIGIKNIIYKEFFLKIFVILIIVSISSLIMPLIIELVIPKYKYSAIITKILLTFCPIFFSTPLITIIAISSENHKKIIYLYLVSIVLYIFIILFFNNSLNVANYVWILVFIFNFIALLSIKLIMNSLYSVFKILTYYLILFVPNFLFFFININNGLTFIITFLYLSIISYCFHRSNVFVK